MELGKLFAAIIKYGLNVKKMKFFSAMNSFSEKKLNKYYNEIYSNLYDLHVWASKHETEKTNYRMRNDLYQILSNFDNYFVGFDNNEY